MSVTIKKSRIYLKLPLTQYLKLWLTDCGYLINTLCIVMFTLCVFLFSREQILFGSFVLLIAFYLAKIVAAIYLEKIQEEFSEIKYVLLSRRQRVDVINEVALIIESLTKNSIGVSARYKRFVDDTFTSHGHCSVWEDLLPSYFTRIDASQSKETYFAVTLHSILKDIVTSSRYIGWRKDSVLPSVELEIHSYREMPIAVQEYIANFFPNLVFLDPLAFSPDVLDRMKSGMAEYMNVLVALQDSKEEMCNKLRTWYKQPLRETMLSNVLPDNLIV